MSVVAFDTHRIVKRLMEVGFSDLQAEAVTDVLSEGRNLDLSHLATKVDLSHLAMKVDLAATKVDLAAMKAELQSEAAANKAELKLALSDNRAELLKWVIGAIGIQTIVVIGAVAALARLI